MRQLGLVLLLLVGPGQLSERDQVQAEKHRLAVQLLTCQESLAGAQVALQKAALTEAQATLEAHFRAVLKPEPGAVFDWQTLTFKPAPEK